MAGSVRERAGESSWRKVRPGTRHTDETTKDTNNGGGGRKVERNRWKEEAGHKGRAQGRGGREWSLGR